MILDHKCQNKCFWGVVGSWWPPFDPQNALKMGCFLGQKNGSKVDQKCVFPKMILSPVVVLKWSEMVPF